MVQIFQVHPSLHSSTTFHVAEEIYYSLRLWIDMERALTAEMLCDSFRSIKEIKTQNFMKEFLHLGDVFDRHGSRHRYVMCHMVFGAYC